MLLLRRRWNFAVYSSQLSFMKFSSMQQKGFAQSHAIRGCVLKKKIATNNQERIRTLNTTSLRRAFVLTSTISGGLYCAYALSISNQNVPFSASLRGRPEEDAVFPAEPSGGFCHPYDEKPLWWRLVLVSKRILILGRCFAPFFVLSVVIFFTDSKEWR